MDLLAVVKNGRIVLDEATDLPEGTVVELGVYYPGTIASDAVGFLPTPLQPAVSTIYNLRQALTDGKTDMAAFYREQLVSDLNGAEVLPLLTVDVAPALRQLLRAPATDIRRQDLAALELALFDARLPDADESSIDTPMY
jgi:hypothetical protein